MSLENKHFGTCCMSRYAFKKGLLNGCRLVICLDDCHIKTKFGDQILTIVDVDANDYIYLIALGLFKWNQRKLGRGFCKPSRMS